MVEARERLVRSGPAALGDEELVALALGGPGALPLARSLLDRHGLDRLRGALAIELAREPGMGLARAVRLSAAVELGRRAAAAQPSQTWHVRSPADVALRLLPSMAHLEREELRVCVLNTRNAVLAEVTVYVGNLAGSAVRVGEVFRDAVRRQAAAIVVVHNHPSGDPSPSSDDLRITADMAHAGRLLDIELLDHVVLGGDRWVSLRAGGAL